MPYFIFNGRNSRDYNIIVNKLPEVHISSNVMEFRDIPGRDGYVTIDKNRREPVIKEMELTIYPADRLNEVMEWLRGKGVITFSNQSEVYHRVIIDSTVGIEGTTNYRTLTVSMTCQPFGYLHEGKETIEVLEQNTVLYNYYTESKPLIKILGSGTIDFMINRQKFNLLLTGNHAFIDSELKECYVPYGPIKHTGSFPMLEKGNNNITWKGNVSRIEVVPRWRK